MNLLQRSADTTFNMESLVFPAPVYRTSMLATNELKAQNHSVRPRQEGQPDWIIGVLLFCFFLLAWNNVYNPKRLLQVIKAPFSRRFVNQLVREGNLFTERIAFTLGVVFVLSFSLFLFMLNEQYLHFSIPELSGSLLYMIIVAGLISYSAIRMVLYRILSVVFKTSETTYQYTLNLLIFNMIIGPVILFFLVFIIYLNKPVILNICLAVVGLLFLLRFFRGFLIGMKLTKFSYVLLFVYLCSLEILPLLVLVKVLLNFAKAAVV